MILVAYNFQNEREEYRIEDLFVKVEILKSMNDCSENQTQI